MLNATRRLGLTQLALENFNLIQMHYQSLGATDACIHDELGAIMLRAMRGRPFPIKPEWLLNRAKNNIHLLAQEELTSAALTIYRAVQSTGELS